MKLTLTAKEVLSLKITLSKMELNNDVKNLEEFIKEGKKSKNVSIKPNLKGELVIDIKEDYVTEMMNTFGTYINLFIGQAKLASHTYDVMVKEINYINEKYMDD